MADSIKISTQVLLETASNIRNTNTQLDDTLLMINKNMDELELSWRSDAGTEIREAMNALKPRFAEYRDVVESYAKFLDSTAQAYEQTEGDIQSVASSFK